VYIILAAHRARVVQPLRGRIDRGVDLALGVDRRPGGPCLTRASAAVTVPPQVRKSLAVKTARVIARR
jgi:hypothetical protein